MHQLYKYTPTVSLFLSHSFIHHSESSENQSKKGSIRREKNSISKLIINVIDDSW